MRNVIRILCGFAAGLLTVPAVAQDRISDAGPYFSFGAGLANNQWIGTDPTTGDVFDFEPDFSWTGIAAIGYSWVPLDSPAGFRVEIEGSYRRTDVESLTDYTGGTVSTVDGYLESIGAMANGYVDFNLGPKTVPYVGAGFGAARVSRRDFSIDGVPVTNKYLHTGAWQVMAGVGFKISPGAIIGVELRHFELLEFNFENTPLDQAIEYGEVLLTFRLIG